MVRDDKKLDNMEGCRMQSVHYYEKGSLLFININPIQYFLKLYKLFTN